MTAPHAEATDFPSGAPAANHPKDAAAERTHPKGVFDVVLFDFSGA